MSEFVERQMRLLRLAAQKPANKFVAVGVVDRRRELASAVQPSAEFFRIRRTIIERQAIGDPPKPAATPVAANDNQPRRRVRRSRATVRGSLAEGLEALLLYRNTPDSLPDPLKSNWSTDPADVIAEADFDENGAPIIVSDLDREREIRPSIAKILEEVKDGAIVRAAPQKVRRGLRTPAVGPITSIGRLRFSDGTARERVTMRTETGIETTMATARQGALLGSSEDVGGVRGGGSSAGATMSNTRTTAVYLGTDEAKKPLHWRPFIPGRKRDIVRKDLTPTQSRALIAEFFACSPTIPPVTKCPPGVATGTARFADQFVGLVTGSTGKGGAPNWVDHFTAVRDREEMRRAIRGLDKVDADALEAAIQAKSFADVGVAAGQSREYARRKGGRRALIAANDNFASALKKLAR